MKNQDYRTLFDAIDHGFCIVEVLFDEQHRPLDYLFLEINATFEAQTGLRDAVGKTMRSLQPDHEAHWFEIYGDIALTGKPLRFEKPAEALGRWYDVYAFRVGAPVERRVAILFNDITQRRRDEERLALLNREIGHRARNMLTVVASIARLTDAETVAAYKKALLGRIDALAISQRLLSEASTEEADIARLMEEELAAFQPTGSPRVTLNGPTIMMDDAAVQALAMAVHELATNAAKHGALSTDQGRVSVEWAQGDDGQVRVRWSETGGPVVKEPSRHGLGIGTIMSCGHDEFGSGQVSFAWRPEGLICDLTLPARARKI
ncbi:MAG: HWE histidine kinase domain-containing protein [Hyphomicrobiaceae bacterium]